MNPELRYLKLAAKCQKTTPDFERLAVHDFPKFCRHCGAGMSELTRSTPRKQRKAFNSGFCGAQCRELGPRDAAGVVRAKATPPPPSDVFPVEEMAFLRIEMERNEKRHPMKALVRKAMEFCTLLSERLRFLEIETGKTWTRHAFRYWMERGEA